MTDTESFYIQKINLALDFIEVNFEKKITTPELADISAFSEFHFHRIFKAIIGETVNQYIKRQKMVKSKRTIQYDTKPITEIAMDYGYSSSANFARDYKQYFNESASQHRQHKTQDVSHPDLPFNLNLKLVGFKEYSPISLIYKRVLTGYNPVEINKAFQELLDWINTNKLAYTELKTYGIGYDDPDFVEMGKCRYDACISLKKDIPVNTYPFNTKTIFPGQCLVYQFEGKGEDFGKAWDYVFKTVVHTKGIRPGDKPHFEEYLYSERFNEGIFCANLCLPVLPIN